jgi:hypothetical protein
MQAHTLGCHQLKQPSSSEEGCLSEADASGYESGAVRLVVV